MSIFTKLHGEGANEKSSQSITASQWLGRDPKIKGYSDAEAFITYCKSLRLTEAEQLEQFFDFVKSGVRIVGAVVTRKDRGGRPYQHPPFLRGNATVGTKVILEGGMKVFLKDYMDAKVSINFTLDELLEEAMNG